MDLDKQIEFQKQKLELCEHVQKRLEYSYNPLNNPQEFIECFVCKSIINKEEFVKRMRTKTYQVYCPICKDVWGLYTEIGAKQIKQEMKRCVKEKRILKELLEQKKCIK